MVDGLIGRKLGMTQVFSGDGTWTAATVLEVGPCVVVQRRTMDRDGYEAAQVGLVDPRAARRANRPVRGHHEKAGVPATRVLREFGLRPGADVKPGDALSVEVFAGVDRVDVVGITKGKGFQGVVRRHGFRGGRATHGSMFHRAPGSIGSSAFPSRVFKGMRAAGQMGARRVTAKNLRVLRIDPEKNLIVVCGSVPGARGCRVLVRRSNAVAGGTPESGRGGES
jgi:large subunit ribosomal protein L3